MNLKLSYIVIAIGALLGILGFVRSGAIAIAVGSAAVTYFRFKYSKKKRKIEFIIPMAVALTLFVVAITLPHGK
jgi:hypothetical protein